MNETGSFLLDGETIAFEAGDTIMDAALRAGKYIPHLCHNPEFAPHGSCRVCIVGVNGRHVSACTQPAAAGAEVENNSAEITEQRRNLLQMLFVEGNHFCMFCEKSGNCELQALAYRFGITAPKYPFMFPQRDLDASHPEIFVDRNRCILCGRCVRASQELDGKQVFGFVGRGITKRVAVNASTNLAETEAEAGDEAIAACPTGSLLVKGVGYAVPVGKRKFDSRPIGSEIENSQSTD